MAELFNDAEYYDKVDDATSQWKLRSGTG